MPSARCSHPAGGVTKRRSPSPMSLDGFLLDDGVDCDWAVPLNGNLPHCSSAPANLFDVAPLDFGFQPASLNPLRTGTAMRHSVSQPALASMVPSCYGDGRVAPATTPEPRRSNRGGRRGSSSPEAETAAELTAAAPAAARTTQTSRVQGATSTYRGVTRHRWTGRYEAHLWDSSVERKVRRTTCINSLECVVWRADRSLVRCFCQCYVWREACCCDSLFFQG